MDRTGQVGPVKVVPLTRRTIATQNTCKEYKIVLSLKLFLKSEQLSISQTQVCCVQGLTVSTV